jgi:hypothetical protein
MSIARHGVFAPNCPMTPTQPAFLDVLPWPVINQDPLQGGSGLILEFSLLDDGYPSLRASSARVHIIEVGSLR